jgi:hypothetical protein
MLRLHFVDNIDAAFSAHNLIIWTDFLHAGTDFHPDLLLSRETHCSYGLLIFAVSYPTLRQIVRCQFYLNAVAWHQPDVVLPHAAGDMSYDLMAVFQFNSKLRAGKGFHHNAGELDYLFLNCHKYNEVIVTNCTGVCKG